nr:reverse transcriptase domain-containing protein [Tanacetum cinerariifolium]
MVVRSQSPYNGIIGRPGVRKLQAVPSTAHGMLNIPVEGGVITLKSSKLVPLECAMVFGPEETSSAAKPIIEERVKVAINPEYPEQTVIIGSTFTEGGRNKLCGLLQRNLDIFAWKPTDMIDVPRHIAEHCLNVREGYSPVRQKKKGQTADRNQAIQEEVGKLVEAVIMREDGYPLPKIDWKVESLCEFHFKCFLDAYKGYHQIQMATKDEDKTAFIISKGIFCYTKMPFGLRNARSTYQRLVDKAFHKQIGKNLEVYVDVLVIKIRTEDEIVRDVEETFKTLKEINMKLNPKKCAFGVEEGMFLGALRGLELNYTSTKKLLLALVHASKRLKKYFQAHPIIVITDQPIQQILSRPEVAGRLQKWSIELREYAIHYRPRVSVKGQILADFIAERPKEDSSDTSTEEEGELHEPWILFTDGSFCTDGSGARLILTNQKGWTEQIGVKNIQANVDSRLVANQVNGTYVAKEADRICYLEKVKALIGSFKEFSIKQFPRSETKKVDALSKIASTSFTHLSTLPVDVKKARAIKRKSWRFAIVHGTLYKESFFGSWLRCIGPLQANYVLREIHEGSCSMHAGTRSVVAKALRTGYYWPTMHRNARTLIRAYQDCQVHKPVPRNPFGLPGEIISDNGKQLRDDPFKDWCEKLCICQHFAFVKHPQTNGLVERTNHSLGEGIKARLDARSKNWI